MREPIKVTSYQQLKELAENKKSVVLNFGYMHGSLRPLAAAFVLNMNYSAIASRMETGQILVYDKPPEVNFFKRPKYRKTPSKLEETTKPNDNQTK